MNLKKIKMNLILTLFLVFFSISARADFLDKFSTGAYIAPYLGRVLNGSLASSPSDPPNSIEPNEAKYDNSGQRYGIQLGWMIGDVVLGIDGSYANLDYSFSSPNNTSVSDSSISISHYGAFIMYRRYKIVPWLGAIFEASASDDKQKYEFKDGSGLQAGVGLKLLRWLQLNFEVRTYSFKTFDQNGTERSLPDDGRKEFKGSEFLIGLSFPFESIKGK